MTWAVYVNEVDLSTIGAYIETLPGEAAAPSRAFPLTAIPGRMGGVPTADPTTATRLLTLQGTIDPPARTVAQRASFEDQLKALCMRGLVQITVDDDVNAPRRIDGLCQSVEIDPVAHPITTQLSRFRATFLCPDPSWYDLTRQIIAFGTVASAIPLGTAPSGGIVRIQAPAWSANLTNPVLSYANAAGVVLQSLTFTLTLTAGTDFLEIDLDRLTAAKVSSGVRTDAISLLTAGDFFALDPSDGDLFNASYPSLKVTTSAGTPSAQWLGVRGWL